MGYPVERYPMTGIFDFCARARGSKASRPLATPRINVRRLINWIISMTVNRFDDITSMLLNLACDRPGLGRFGTTPVCRLTTNRRLAIILQLAHDGGVRHQRAAAIGSVFERQTDVVFGEERVELFRAERSYRVNLVACSVVRKDDRRERLRGRTGDHARTRGGIVDTVVRATMNNVARRRRRAVLLEADERNVARRIRELVRADRREGHEISTG